MSRPRVLLSHPTGNQNVRNALASLTDREMLAEFWTTVAWDTQSGWNCLLPSRMRMLLERRAYPGTPTKLVRCFPWKEMVRLAAEPTLLKSPLASRERAFSIIGVYWHFDGQVARRLSSLRPNAVYAYEGGALQTFSEAKRLGITTLYEQPSNYWYWVRQMLTEEAVRSPEFADLLPNLEDSTGHLEWKDEELALADYVLVPSQHVRRTLAGAVLEKKSVWSLTVLPRSGNGRGFPSTPLGRCRFFFGTLAQHKGIGYLLDAVERTGSQVELTLVGKLFQPNAHEDAACYRWRWFESLPNSAVLNMMTEADVIVLLSLAEGCALVVLEALSSGLPVIVTPNTGSLEFMRDGWQGFVVPICRSDAIADRLSTHFHDRKVLGAMSRNVQATATEKSGEKYRAIFADTLRAVVSCS